MKFLKEEEDLENGDPAALDEIDIKNLIRFADAGKNDVFYDLGSGFGEIVLQFVKQSKVKKSYGIEEDIKRYLHSIEYTRDEIAKNKLNKIDFWRADYNYYDFSNATIIYNGIDVAGGKKRGDFDEIKLYNKLFKNKEVKIIKRDFPLIGYKPVKSRRYKDKTWFFMMKTPLEKYRIHNYDEWLYHIFKKKNKKIDDVLKYYARSYKTRNIDLIQQDVKDFKMGFKRMIKKQFR